MTAGLAGIVVLLLLPLLWAGWRQQQSHAHLLGTREAIRELREDVAALSAEMHAQNERLRAENAELAERLDFAERSLAQVRDSRALPPTRDVR